MPKKRTTPDRPSTTSRESAWAPVYRLVRRIPRGRVMNYGQIAKFLGGRLTPRAVGWAMHDCPADVPWHRVVNAAGRCSTDEIPDSPPGLQRSLLEDEGVEFRASGSLNLEHYRWTPPAPRPRKTSPSAKPAKVASTRKSRGRSAACRP